jgi:hypothetical protein
VQAATLSTLWNRWTTNRRFPGQGGDFTGCYLGCTSHRDLDAIEHYLRCPIVLEAARRRLGLNLHPDTSLEHLLLAGQPPEDGPAHDWWATCALLVYATYRTTNAARHTRRMTPNEAIKAIQQALYEGAKLHTKATRLVDRRGRPAP